MYASTSMPGLSCKVKIYNVLVDVQLLDKFASMRPLFVSMRNS
jgi:hypothetical protein